MAFGTVFALYGFTFITDAGGFFFFLGFPSLLVARKMVRQMGMKEMRTRRGKKDLYIDADRKIFWQMIRMLISKHSYLVARKMVKQMRMKEMRARRQGTMIGARARWTGWGGGEGSRVWQVYVYNWLVYWYLRLLYWYIFTRQDGVVGEGSRA